MIQAAKIIGTGLARTGLIGVFSLPSQIFTCISLLYLTTSGGLTMHGFQNSDYWLFFAPILLISSMFFSFIIFKAFFSLVYLHVKQVFGLIPILSLSLCLCLFIFIRHLVLIIEGEDDNEDKDEVYGEIGKLEEEYSEFEGELEEVREEIIEDEADTENSENSTELSKDLREDSELKDKKISGFQKPRDEALFDDNNNRQEKSLALKQLKSSIEIDQRTVERLKSEVPKEDLNYKKIENLDSTLSNLKSGVHQVDKKMAATLPDIGKKSFPQDTSNFYPENTDLPPFNEDE